MIWKLLILLGPSYLLHFYDLFNDAVSSLHYIKSNARMINELEIMWKEAVVA
jgi:hypothetical protein